MLAQRMQGNVFSGRQPTYLTELNASQLEALKDVARFDSLPWHGRVRIEQYHIRQEAYQIALNFESKMTHFHKLSRLRRNPSNYNQQVQMLCFEALCQLVANVDGYENWLLDKMKTDVDLQDAINYLASSIRLKKLGTSGIAPYQLERFAIGMENVSHLSRASFESFYFPKKYQRSD